MVNLDAKRDDASIQNSFILDYIVEYFSLDFVLNKGMIT